MKNLNVEFAWNSVTVKLYYEVPTATTDLNVQTAILTALSVYGGNTLLSLSHKIANGSTWNYSDAVPSSTTDTQIASAINSAVTIIGGRSRRG
jgi:hypothetical protein